MNRRSLSIIALLLAVFATSAAWGKKNAASIPLTAQYGNTDCGNGMCEGGEGYILCPEDCPTQCGDGYCDNYETQEGGQYFCAQDCRSCDNGGEWPACCPEGRSGPYCECENGSSEPDCGEPEDLPCDTAEEMNTPECNACIGGTCSDEDLCGGGCTGPGERCEGKELSDEERSNKCDCKDARDPDEFCRNNGIGFEFPDNAKGQQGKYCDGSCHVTQCSDGVANKEKSVGNEYVSADEEFNDRQADAKDIGCYACEDCALAGHVTADDFDPTRSEYDSCHDPATPPKMQGNDVELAFEQPSLWQSLLAAIAPNDPGGKVYSCAVNGHLAYDDLVDPSTQKVTSTFVRAGKGIDEQACTHCAAPDTLAGDKDADGNIVSCADYVLKKVKDAEQKITDQLAKDKAKIQQIPNWNKVPLATRNAFLKALDKKAEYDKKNAAQLKYYRDTADNWCTTKCNDPKNYEGVTFKNGVIPAPMVALCMQTCSCGCYPDVAVGDETALITQQRKNREKNVPLPADDFGAQCFARCYYQAAWNGGGKSETLCLAECKSFYCPAETKFPPNPVINPPFIPSGAPYGGGSGGGGGGEVCYGQFSNGCQYDLCTIMSWYGMSCGPNFPSLPNIGGAAGGGGGGTTAGATGGGTSTPTKTATTGGTTGGGGGGDGGTTGTTGGTTSASVRFSSVSSMRSGSSSPTLGSSSRSSSPLTVSSSRSLSSGSSTSRSSSASSRSTSSFRTSGTSSVFLSLVCPPDACSANNNAGNSFCAQQGMSCVSANGIPCIRCVAGQYGSSSFPDIYFDYSSRSSSRFLCGDGQTNPGEECDDGNLTDTDGCSTDCRRLTTGYSSRSSQRFVTANGSSSSASSRTYVALLFCGNNVLNEGEECDLGTQNSDLPNSSCRTDCSLSRCGDRIVDSVRGESCDDGNAATGDGCSVVCQLEQGAAVSNAPAGVLPGSLIELPFIPGLPSQGTVVPSVPVHGPVGNTGPETIAIMAAGASAGYAWLKTKRKKP